MKERIFSWIDNSLEIAAELQTELTRRPAISPESGGEGELEKCNFLESWLRSQGIASLQRYDAPDKRARGAVRPNLLATIPGSTDAGCLWIISHIDVVPPGELSLWNSDPWEAVFAHDAPLGKRFIGRGVEDNQQGLVSSVLAALAFVRQEIQPQRTVKLLFAADEENGSAYGIDWLLKNHGTLFHKNDMVLIPDSGDAMGQSIEIAEKNILWICFVTRGVQAHGSRPDQGINALLAGADLLMQLHRDLSEIFADHDPLFEPDYSTFQPTKKEANVPNINTIPPEDIFYMDMRILPRYSTSSVLHEVDRITAEVAARHKVAIDYSLVQKNESPPTAADAPLVLALSEAIREVYPVNPRPVGIGGGTVGAFLRRAGIDCAVWAKIDNTAHQPNEYALVDNILGDSKVMALLMLP